ncbi:putative reverse transcriptase domain-containing protein [Tanacetum coccineum]|uniref:Pyruvate kinase n=1 Tax=Tanacetum coccineum TaxID=301880 RepID=A0ABQ5DI15_9ASTR
MYEGLTSKDIIDLDFVGTHADIVGISFVRNVHDIVVLREELKKRKLEHLRIVLKIETKDGLKNLPILILEAMKLPNPLGVMIAIGDLVVECGWEMMADIQEQILSICSAAHVLVIWAAQVLESLVKTSVPTRAEITDVACGRRASCIMLNKGKHILEAIDTLDTILKSSSTNMKAEAKPLTYLRSTTIRLEEMRVKRRDAEQWMSYHLLPDPLKERIRRYEQYKWQETRGVDEDSLIRNLPKDLRRDIKRHSRIFFGLESILLWIIAVSGYESLRPLVRLRGVGAVGANRNNPARNASTTTDAPMSVAAINQLIETRVAEALANQEQLRNIGVNGDGSQNSRSGTERPTRTLRECTYKDFLNCRPLNFKGTEGVVVLSQWFEKMESVFHISNCAPENQVKFATCTFTGNALTWWNSHMKAVTQDVAYAMDWKALKKMMTVKYCPRGENKEVGIEIREPLKESDEVEKYVGGLPDMIRGNVMSYRPKTMEEAIEFANDQMDQKVLTISERQAEQKRKLEFNAGNNQGYQQLPKRQSVAQAYAVGTGERKEYARTLPLCNKCKFHHHSPCTVKCANYKKVGHSRGIVGNLLLLTIKDHHCYVNLYVTLLEERTHHLAKVLAKVGTVAYKPELPQQLSKVHNTFHVSNMKRCLSDELVVIPLGELRIDDKLQFVEEPVEIMEREIKRLKRSRIPLVKVRLDTWRRSELHIVGT